MKTLELGSISTGTLRAEDLFEAFVDTLATVSKAKANRYHREYDKIATYEMLDGTAVTLDEWLPEAVEELEDLLDQFCPPYTYFGAHPGDGADFGVWVAMETLEYDLRTGEEDIVSYDDIPKGYTGYVVNINDHGNVTLYKATRGRLREIWAIV